MKLYNIRCETKKHHQEIVNETRLTLLRKFSGCMRSSPLSAAVPPPAPEKIMTHETCQSTCGHCHCVLDTALMPKPSYQIQKITLTRYLSCEKYL